MSDALVALGRRVAQRARGEEISAGIVGALFDRQRALIEDPSTTKAALCSRRAGKTHTAVAYLLVTALRRPGSTSVYVALTRMSAKRLIWRTLIATVRVADPAATYNSTELTVYLSNGSVILVTGAHDEADGERLRGGKYALVVVDECASFPVFFASLVEEVIEPALIDERGTLCLLGTPGAACVGYFHAVTTGSHGFSVHRWTILDNPHLPHARQYLADLMVRKGWTDESPIYRREWLGQWVHSTEGLVYRFDPLRNVGTPPEGAELSYVLGVDLGFNDEFAIAVLAFAMDSPRVWAVDGFSASGMLPSDWADKIEAYRDRYDPIAMAIDAGALGKPIVLEMVQRRGLALEAADKRDKVAAIELLNSDLVSGRLQIAPGLRVADEMMRLQWDPDLFGTQRRKEDGRFPNNNADALLYAWRKCQHWTQRDEPALPKAGTPARYNADADAAKAAKIKELARRQRDPWGYDG